MSGSAATPPGKEVAGRPRAVATEVLARVRRGAYASAALDGELARAGLSARDAALIAQIVYGALRVAPRLDATLSRFVRRGLGELDDWAHALLWSATYQLLYLARVPPHAAVNEAVEEARRARGPKVAGFVNAVLRKVAEERPDEPDANPPIELPEWLDASLVRSLGAERASAFRQLRALPPPIDLRVELRRTSREALRAQIAAARPDAEIEDGALSPSAIRLRGAGDPRTLPGFEEGLFVVQEEGSQVIADLVGAMPGERVADACAGRGGKTAILAAAVTAAGSVTAIDVNEARLAQIQSSLERLAIATPLEIEAIDLSVGTAGLDGRFDAVLVDAPCTGVGTIHRRPEILLRLEPGDPSRLGIVQAAIVRNAARLLRPGGRLVYAVCSPLEEEGKGALQSFEEFGLRPDDRPLPPSVRSFEDEDGWIRLGPFGEGSRPGTDAYQVRRFRAH